MTTESTILIVDDTPVGRKVLAALLNTPDYRLVFAGSGMEALEQAQRESPDLVLLDVMMPEMDGFEVCRRLRQDPVLAEVPIILVTALDDQHSRIQGIEAGADDFLSKPFDRAELRARVRTITRLNRYRRLQGERARFEWVVNQSDDGFVLLDEEDRVTYANTRARRYLRLPMDEQEPIAATFFALVQQQYKLEPADAWEKWLTAGSKTADLYLLLPESETVHAFWLRVDQLALPDRQNGRLVRLRDVTSEMILQRDMRTFDALVKHKLRTPLVGLVGGLNLLVRQSQLDGLSDTATELAQIALRGAQRFQRTVEDILIYLNAAQVAHSGAGCSLDKLPPMVQNISETLGIDVDRLTLPPDTSDMALALSPQAVEQILWELLENAQKFHPRTIASVSIDVALFDQGRVRLRVQDDGITLSPEQLGRMFTPYYQGEKEFTGEVPGMGLGMATVASLVWSVGGTCRAANRTDSPGVSIELLVPCKAVSPLMDMGVAV